jgi:hypothetical protein
MIVIGRQRGAIPSSRHRKSYLMDQSCWAMTKLRRKFCISTIHPAETFPLILAIGVVIQGLVFAGVQGQGLQALLADDCDVIAQILFPGMYLSLSMESSQLTG